MNIAWPNPVIHSIARRRAVILIGSGVSANSKAPSGVSPPTWGVFLNDAYRRIGKNVPHIKRALKLYRYLEACEYLKDELGTSWAEIVGDAFITPGYKAAEIHSAIFNLDVRIVASLNFDKIYDNYAIKSSESSFIIKNYYDDDIRQVLIGQGRYILKPHGSAETVSKMIFTLEEYARARIAYSAFYDIIAALLHTHTFICIGCGLSDPDMKLVFEDYRYRFNEIPHYIVLPKPMSIAECKLIERTRGLQVILYSSKNDHRELTDSLVELSILVEHFREDLSKNQNW